MATRRPVGGIPIKRKRPLFSVKPVWRVLSLAIWVRGHPERQGVAHVCWRMQRRALEQTAAAVCAWAHEPHILTPATEQHTVDADCRHSRGQIDVHAFR